MTEWLAIGVGLAGGSMFSYHVGKAALPPWGAIGIVTGVAAVFASVLLCGTFAGVMLAKLLTRPEA